MSKYNASVEYIVLQLDSTTIPAYEVRYWVTGNSGNKVSYGVYNGLDGSLIASAVASAIRKGLITPSPIK